MEMPSKVERALERLFAQQRQGIWRNFAEMLSKRAIDLRVLLQRLKKRAEIEELMLDPEARVALKGIHWALEMEAEWLATTALGFLPPYDDGEECLTDAMPPVQ